MPAVSCLPSAAAMASLLALVLTAAPCWAQVPAQVQPASPVTPTPGAAASRPRGPAAKATAAPVVAAKPAEAKPSWVELTPPQRQALAPLAGSWLNLGEAHKRKWLALSQNFPKLPATEQAMLHSRMKEWAALSPKERTLARLNFGETRRFSPDDKKAKWEAYQALPAAEKNKLAADAAVKPPTTAAAIKPVPQQKLATVPKKSGPEAKAPRIAAAPPAESGHPPGPGRPPAHLPAQAN